MTTKTKKCPTCNSTLTTKQYDKAMGMVEEKEKALKEAQKLALKATKDLQEKEKKFAHNKKKFQQDKKKHALEVKKLKDEGKALKIKMKKEFATKTKSEVDKAVKKKEGQLNKAIENNKKIKLQLERAKKGTNEIDEGFENEKKLCAKLKKMYSKDIIKVVGKKGDILHTIKNGAKEIGSIIYECKKVGIHAASHVNQTLMAKNDRGAIFGVLVTTGKSTKTFTGFKIERDVIIVRPAAILVIAGVLREQIIEMDRQKIDDEKKNLAARKALNFLKSNHFKGPITNSIRLVEQNVNNLNKEMKDHARDWNRRYQSYFDIKNNLGLVLDNSGNAIKGRAIKFIKGQKVVLELPRI